MSIPTNTTPFAGTPGGELPALRREIPFTSSSTRLDNPRQIVVCRKAPLFGGADLSSMGDSPKALPLKALSDPSNSVNPLNVLGFQGDMHGGKIAETLLHLLKISLFLLSALSQESAVRFGGKDSIDHGSPHRNPILVQHLPGLKSFQNRQPLRVDHKIKRGIRRVEKPFPGIGKSVFPPLKQSIHPILRLIIIGKAGGVVKHPLPLPGLSAPGEHSLDPNPHQLRQG